MTGTLATACGGGREAVPWSNPITTGRQVSVTISLGCSDSAAGHSVQLLANAVVITTYRHKKVVDNPRKGCPTHEYVEQIYVSQEIGGRPLLDGSCPVPQTSAFLGCHPRSTR